MSSVVRTETLPSTKWASSRHASLANALRNEFATPFALFHPESHEPVCVPPEFPPALADEDTMSHLVHRVVSSAEVEFAELLPGLQLLGLPVWKGDELAVVGVGVFRTWAPASDSWEPDGCQEQVGVEVQRSTLASFPQRCLESWAKAVADRQRLKERLRDSLGESDTLRNEASESARMLQVLDRIATRLRISDRPERFQKLVLGAVLESMPVDSVAWVPANPHEATQILGQMVLEEDRLRRIVNESIHQGDPATRLAMVENGVRQTLWGIPCSKIASIAIIGTDEKKSSGWLVALNKKGTGGFTANDSVLLRPVASLLNVYRKNLGMYVDLKELVFGVVRALSSAIDAKDPYTRGHSERVARLAVCLGRQMMLGSDELSNLYLAGLLHDVGKIGVEDQVLKKPGRLTPDEYRHVMSHVEIGVSILRELKRLRHVLPGILHHHERFDGGGYPDGIKGDDIPLIARILAVADSFDAMSSDRPYRPRRSPEEVLSILRQGANNQWDGRVVEAALSCWSELCTIQHRAVGESLRVAVDEAMHHDYPGNDSRPCSAVPI